MFTGHDRLLFELGTAQRLGPPAVWQQAWVEHQATGQPFATILLRRGGVEPSVLLGAVATHLGWDYVGDLPSRLPPAVLDLMPADLARSHGVVPLAARGRTITLLALDPFNPGLVNDLTFILGRDVRLAVAEPAGIQRLLTQHYGEEPESLDSALDALVATAAAPGATGENDAAGAELAGSTPLIRFVNLVLARGICDGVSDIHFEPFEQEFKIRYRRDGTLYELLPPPHSLARPVISRLKVMANLDIAERRLPQDGRIKLTLDGRAVDLRVSTLPTQFGESVVLRVLDQSSGRLELGELGLPESLRRGVEEIIHRPHGIFLVTGPTGSGKTTTLYGCLKTLNQHEAKLLTVEDPVEYELDGVMQVPVNLPAGLTFARALRSFLRQDPDIVMVGEIRDAETAQIALQAALTGHLVLSTLHTNDAPGGSRACWTWELRPICWLPPSRECSPSACCAASVRPARWP
ncbi:MAG: GspE/PulE family protein [Opitutae bacterium]